MFSCSCHVVVIIALCHRGGGHVVVSRHHGRGHITVMCCGGGCVRVTLVGIAVIASRHHGQVTLMCHGGG